MTVVLFGLACVLVVEGLALALAPRRMEDILRLIASVPQERRRALGLAAVAIGAVVLWLIGPVGPVPAAT